MPAKQLRHTGSSIHHKPRGPGSAAPTWRRHRNARHKHGDVSLQRNPRPREADRVQVAQETSEDSINGKPRYDTDRLRRKYARPILTAAHEIVIMIRKVGPNVAPWRPQLIYRRVRWSRLGTRRRDLRTRVLRLGRRSRVDRLVRIRLHATYSLLAFCAGPHSSPWRFRATKVALDSPSIRWKCTIRTFTNMSVCGSKGRGVAILPM